MTFEDLEIVLKVAECSSITGAATHLDKSRATASAAIKRVENALGTELFIRTTRQLRLSSAGERYIAKCEQALILLEQARQQLKSDLDIVDGELRIAVSSDLGRNIVRPWLNDFIETYPDVRIQLSLSDSNVDLFRNSIDIALRYLGPGALTDENLYGFKICNVPHLLCASPTYLKKHGAPTHPNELRSHNGLLYQLYDITHDIWTFTQGETDYKIKMRSSLTGNDGDLVRRWCVDGKGLAIKSCLDISADLLSENLVPVMADFKPSSTELWLIFPSRQLITPAARLLRDTIKKNCTDILTQLIEKDIIDENVLD